MFQTLLRNASWQGITLLLVNALGLIFTLVLAHYLGAGGLGEYSYLFALFAFLIQFIDLGTAQHYLRKWSETGEAEVEDLQDFLFSRLLVFFLAALVITPYMWFQENSIFSSYLVVLVIHFFDHILAVPLSLSQAKNDFKTSFYLNGVGRGVSILLAILFLILRLPLPVALLGFVLGRGLSFFIAWKKTQAYLIPRSSWKKTYGLLQKSFSLFLLGAFTTLYFRIDSIMIRHILGFEALGLYSAAYRLFEACILLSTVVVSAVVPSLVSLVAKNDFDAIAKLFRKLFSILLSFSIVTIITISLYGNEIMDLLYGDTFIGGGVLLMYLTWAIVFFYTNQFMYFVLFAMKKERILIYTLSFLSIFNIGANIFFLPRFGLTAAALITLVTEILFSLLLWNSVGFLKIHLEDVLKNLALGGIFLTAVSLMKLTTNLHIIVIGVIAGVLYLGLLFLTGIIQKELIAFAFEALSPRTSKDNTK